MKNKKILLLVLTVLMTSSVLTACKSTPKKIQEKEVSVVTNTTKDTTTKEVKDTTDTKATTPSKTAETKTDDKSYLNTSYNFSDTDGILKNSQEVAQKIKNDFSVVSQDKKDNVIKEVAKHKTMNIELRSEITKISDANVHAKSYYVFDRKDAKAVDYVLENCTKTAGYINWKEFYNDSIKENAVAITDTEDVKGAQVKALYGFFGDNKFYLGYEMDMGNK